MNTSDIAEAAFDINNVLVKSIRQDYEFLDGDFLGPLREVGGYCVAFPMRKKTGNGKICFRVWWVDNENLFQFSREVSESLKKIDLPYFIQYEYVDQALNVEGTILHGVKMEWIDGENLDKYIIKNKNHPSKLKDLADRFYAMCKDLINKGISHGDLSHSNILVTSSGELRLVDYDSLYLPSMSRDYEQTVSGQVPYQHPKRINSDKRLLISEIDDNFSQIVIYLTLLAIAKDPTLIKLIPIPEDPKDNIQYLLFSESDLRNSSYFIQSKAYKEIASINDSNVQKCLQVLEKVIDGPFEQVPNVIKVIEGKIPQITQNRCPVCGTLYILSCTNCGYPQKINKSSSDSNLNKNNNSSIHDEQDKIQCPYCNKYIISKNTNFCPHCGNKFIFCSFCGKVHRSDITFCPTTGKRLHVCPHCGGTHKEGTRFCPATGKLL